MVKVEVAAVTVEVEALLVASPPEVTEVEAVLVACPSEVIEVEVETVLVACPSGVTEVEVEAVLVTCPSGVVEVEAVLVTCPLGVTEVNIEPVLVACPSEVTEVTAVELLGGGGSVTAPVGATVAAAKPSGDRRELEAWGSSTFCEVFPGGGGKWRAAENSPTAVVRMLSAEGSSVSHLLG